MSANQIIKVLMERDGLSLEEATQQLQEAKDAIYEGEDPQEVLQDFFGLEPDYILDLLE